MRNWAKVVMYDEPREVSLYNLDKYQIFRTTVGCPRNRVTRCYMGAEVSTQHPTVGSKIISYMSYDIYSIPIKPEDGKRYKYYFANTMNVKGLIDEDYQVFREDKIGGYLPGYTDVKCALASVMYEVIGELVAEDIDE